MEKKKCEICHKKDYEKILLYDSYIKALTRDTLDPKIRKKIENFKNQRKKYIYTCDDCLKKIKGIHGIKVY